MQSSLPGTGHASEGHVVVFDLETQRLFQEVGGPRQAHKLGLAVGVTYDVDADRYTTYFEPDVEALVEQLFVARLVVGFNSLKFDYAVLRPYTKLRFNRLPSLDIFDHLYRRTGFRSSLNTVAGETLGESKSGDGLEANAWWKAGKVDQVVDYCRDDVRITYEVYRYGIEHGAVFTRSGGRKIKIPVMW